MSEETHGPVKSVSSTGKPAFKAPATLILPNPS